MWNLELSGRRKKEKSFIDVVKQQKQKAAVIETP